MVNQFISLFTILQPNPPQPVNKASHGIERGEFTEAKNCHEIDFEHRGVLLAKKGLVLQTVRVTYATYYQYKLPTSSITHRLITIFWQGTSQYQPIDKTNHAKQTHRNGKGDVFERAKPHKAPKTDDD